MKYWSPITVALAATAAVSACSSVTPYQHDVRDFSQGVSVLAEAGSQAGKAYADILFQDASAVWAAHPVQLAISRDCSMAAAFRAPTQSPSAPPCQIVQSGTTGGQLDTLQSQIRRTNAYLSVLQRYATLLVSISNSADSDTLSGNIASFNSTLTELGNAVGNADPLYKAPEQTAMAGVGELGDLFTNYLNWQRFRALRDSVHHGNPIVGRTVDLLRPVFLQVTEQLVEHLTQQISAMPIMVARQAERVAIKDRVAAIAAARAKANRINALLDADPANVAVSLAEAHATLDQALQGARSEADAARAMATFLKTAQNAQAAFTQAVASLGQ